VTVYRNARVMTCDPARGGLGLIDKGAVIVDAGRVAWVGEDREVDTEVGADAIDLRGRLLTPGLVDCHTHAVFAGDRADEFAMRADGKSYLEIAEAGGGIQATLGPTRAASDDVLGALLDDRLALARATGTTTMEVKSGYALTVDGELRLLRVASARRGVVPTLLVHLVPADRRDDRDAYVREWIEQTIPRAAADKLATSVDAWCDRNAFTLDESRAIWRAAAAHGLGVRGHVGQFDDIAGAELLAELGGWSADHLEQVSDAGAAAMARAGTVAVMLPGACVQLKLPVPPVERLRRAGVAMAVATDLNPGSSFSTSLPLQMWLATTHFGMTVEETWLGVTRRAARALRVDAGMIVPGAAADLVVWATDQPADVCYRYGMPLVERVIA
jgi:imidazolonepropionase